MAFRYWIGSILVLLGVGALVDQVYFIDFGHWVSLFWPLAIILLGVLLLVTRSATVLGSTILILFGIIMEISALGLAKNNFWDLFWPSLIILAGIYMIFWMGRRTDPSASSGDLIQHFVIFSGLESRHTNANFRGGSVFAAFGGANVDLRDTQLSQDGAHLELTVAFGGITIIVPEGWRLDINGLPLFGGWSNKTRNQTVTTEGPVLNIRCLAMFGGIEIKN